jgi:NTE family protein
MARTPFETVALVLQGGGALGSYQAGVYEGLAEADIHPDWVAGISIGAFNTAIIAGNPPETRVAKLREFWETICRPAYVMPGADLLQGALDHAHAGVRKAYGAFEAWRAIVEGQRDFFKPRGLAPWLGLNEGPARASYYDTTELKSTLERVVDFDRINAAETRVSVGAVNVRTGNFEYFDNTRGKTRGHMRAEHFMASGALPPALPAVEIDGEFFWDGGIVSNTPLSEVLQTSPRQDTLIFQVDLWSALGPLPQNVFDVAERQKDIQFSSRTRAITDSMARQQRYRRLLRDVLAHVPASKRDANDPLWKEADEVACGKRYSVIQLVYQDKEWEGLSKDYEFSPGTMHEHWRTGLEDIRLTLEHGDWLQLPRDGKEFVTHDRHRGRTRKPVGAK